MDEEDQGGSSCIRLETTEQLRDLVENSSILRGTLVFP